MYFLITFFRVTLKNERTNPRLIILLCFSAVCFFICFKTFFTGQLDELYHKSGNFVSEGLVETMKSY